MRVFIQKFYLAVWRKISSVLLGRGTRKKEKSLIQSGDPQQQFQIISQVTKEKRKNGNEIIKKMLIYIKITKKDKEKLYNIGLYMFTQSL